MPTPGKSSVLVVPSRRLIQFSPDRSSHHLDLEVAAAGSARLAAQPDHQGRSKVQADAVVLGRAAGHGDGTNAVELVAQFLLLLPREELVQGHRLAQGDGHGG